LESPRVAREGEYDVACLVRRANDVTPDVSGGSRDENAVTCGFTSPSHKEILTTPHSENVLMRLSARLSLAATCCALAFTGACSDSTSPDSSQDAAHLAAHFDSLYVDAAAHSDTSYEGRSLLLSFLEVAPALGANATNITVTTANGTEHWKGFEIADLFVHGDTTDTTYIVAAYRESEVHTMVVAIYGQDGSIQTGGLLTNDTLDIGPDDGGGSTTRTSLGSTCTQPSSSLQNPFVLTLNVQSCNVATFSTSMTLVMPSTPGADVALTSLSFPTTTFNGVWVVEGANTGTAAVRRVRAMLRKGQGGNQL
jgi:hypothetical protein